ncbi:hypothetical protein EZV62_027170 [Acer yangbiense]|uniref:Uncharacterized protein n=1 Tax=Acer yangbiense TaxID=1000413 RepID=A0A5C7GUU0_9ROSI|nr:hypothetical protein EZV62_027170 [Acer yangbiense]
MSQYSQSAARVSSIRLGNLVEGFWWDEQSIESLDLKELNQYVESMEVMRKLVALKVDEMEKGSDQSPSDFLAMDSNSLLDASASSEAANIE